MRFLGNFSFTAATVCALLLTCCTTDNAVGAMHSVAVGRCWSWNPADSACSFSAKLHILDVASSCVCTGWMPWSYSSLVGREVSEMAWGCTTLRDAFDSCVLKFQRIHKRCERKDMAKVHRHQTANKEEKSRSVALYSETIGVYRGESIRGRVAPPRSLWVKVAPISQKQRTIFSINMNCRHKSPWKLNSVLCT